MLFKIRALEEIVAKWNDCEKCGLCDGRKTVVHWRGSPNAKIMAIGEGPGADEDRLGIPFVGSAGRMLDQLFIWAGLAPDEDVFITNIVACRPPNNREPTTEEARACRPRLLAMMQIVEPKVLLLMGGTASKRIAGITAITKWRGKQTDVELLAPNNQVLEYTAVPTFHPSYLNRMGGNAKIKNQMLEDIGLAIGVINGKK